MKNHYKTLELESFESDKEKIKSAYRRLALLWHPDRCNDKELAEHTMKDINEAYRILTSEKESYDEDLNRFAMNKAKNIFEDIETGTRFTFTDFSFSNDTTKAVSEELRKKLKIKKLMDDLTMDEFEKVEKFLALLRGYKQEFIK